LEPWREEQASDLASALHCQQSARTGPSHLAFAPDLKTRFGQERLDKMVRPQDRMADDVLEEAPERSPALLQEAWVGAKPLRGQSDDAPKRVLTVGVGSAERVRRASTDGDRRRTRLTRQSASQANSEYRRWTPGPSCWPVPLLTATS
jgi:hypothetical protein